MGIELDDMPHSAASEPTRCTWLAVEREPDRLAMMLRAALAS
jgi:hypothetical protein